MGQQQNQSANALPLGLTACDELVNNDLCTVCKIPKLRFPNGQEGRVYNGVTILKAEHGHFGQDAVVGAKLFVRIELGERKVHLASLGVCVTTVAVRERAAHDVLPGYADTVALQYERAVGQELGHAPVHKFRFKDHFLAAFDQLGQLGMNGKTSGKLGQGFCHGLEILFGRRCVDGFLKI